MIPNMSEHKDESYIWVMNLLCGWLKRPLIDIVPISDMSLFDSTWLYTSVLDRVAINKHTY